MPTFWRISDFADLNGEGGRLAPGRWHNRGRPIVYMSEHPALALLENIVHLDIDLADLPHAYQLLEVEVPATVRADALVADDLAARSPDWRNDLSFTRSLGDGWLAAGRTALFRVPSVVLPKSTNVLLNPLHGDARLARIVSTTRPPYDARLFRGAG